ncbi:MAG: aconitase X [Christensenellales bacterium]
MRLTAEEKGILEGKEGKTKAKIMQTLVEFGEVFGAKRLVKVTANGHLVTSFGIGLLKPVYRIMDEIIDAGLKTKYPFTVDPRPIDYKNVKCGLLNKLIFSKVMYSQQKHYEEQLSKIGLRNKDSFTCTTYLSQVGNVPKYGDVLSWAESSAVVFANSVLGARCNRNSGMLDIFGAILGKVPEFGLLTDEGRKATWKIELKTKTLPEAQILGSAIGMKVMEEVPYIVGLDKFLGKELNDDVISYLKDFGAATASNGAVGLYHIENLTPEAKKMGKKLLTENVKTYVIDDKELERVYKSYPVMWKNQNAKPSLCFIGCPHLSFGQLKSWTKLIEENLQKSGRTKVAVRTIMTCAPDVLKEFEKTEEYQKLLSYKVKISSICPLMYTNNPIAGGKPIITNSNKLRTYSKARYYKDQDIVKIICGVK